MVESALYRLTVTLAATVGAAGFVLALLAWRVFQGTPFGRTLVTLVVFMLGFSLYHVLALVAPGLHDAAEVLETAAFLLIVVFAGMMVRLHRQMSRQTTTSDAEGVADS